MSNVYTDFPKPIGEAGLARSLSSIQDDKLHLWFGLNFIPDVRDIDILLYHEDAVFFVIEVKAVSLEQIEEFGWQNANFKVVEKVSHHTCKRVKPRIRFWIF